MISASEKLYNQIERVAIRRPLIIAVVYRHSENQAAQSLSVERNERIKKALSRNGFVECNLK